MSAVTPRMEEDKHSPRRRSSKWTEEEEYELRRYLDIEREKSTADQSMVVDLQPATRHTVSASGATLARPSLPRRTQSNTDKLSESRTTLRNGGDKHAKSKKSRTVSVYRAPSVVANHSSGAAVLASTVTSNLDTIDTKSTNTFRTFQRKSRRKSSTATKHSTNGLSGGAKGSNSTSVGELPDTRTRDRSKGPKTKPIINPKRMSLTE